MVTCISPCPHCIIDVRPASSGFETARQWLHLNARNSHHYLLHVPCNHISTLCMFSAERIRWKPNRSLFCQSFLIWKSCSSLITDWHDKVMLCKRRMLNKFRVVITALWMSNRALDSTSGLFNNLLSHTLFFCFKICNAQQVHSTCIITSLYHQMAPSIHY